MDILDEIIAEFSNLLRSGVQIPDSIIDMLSQILEGEIQSLTSRPEQAQPPSPPSQGANLGSAPTPDAQLLWILSGQNEQAFLQYLTTYPTPETQNLLRNPTELQRVVGYLNQMMPPGEPLVAGGMPHADLNSSTIWGTQYDPKSGQMKVRFQGGAEYVYQGIPPNIYKAFSQGQASAKTKGSNDYGAWWVGKNPSLGAALNQYIKAGGFPYQRIN